MQLVGDRRVLKTDAAKLKTLQLFDTKLVNQLQKVIHRRNREMTR